MFYMGSTFGSSLQLQLNGLEGCLLTKAPKQNDNGFEFKHKD